MAQAKPIKLLIAALGGEGGGVLASWLHAAAIASGHFVQGTSIPGVAQRTGATTYYLELVPDAGERHRTPGARPVLALNAAPGEVDLVVASELLESTRAIGAGFVTPDRTVLIASSARVFTVDEKAAMGDGRLDQERMLGMAERFSRRAVIADFAAIAAQAEEPAQCRAAGRHRRHRRAADPGRGLPRRHPRRGQGGRRQPARLRGGVEQGVRPLAQSGNRGAGLRSSEGLTRTRGLTAVAPSWPPFLPKRTPSWPKASSASPTTRTAPTPGAISPASTGSSARPAPTARSSASSPATSPCA